VWDFITKETVWSIHVSLRRRASICAIKVFTPVCYTIERRNLSEYVASDLFMGQIASMSYKRNMLKDDQLETSFVACTPRLEGLNAFRLL
jgi:hypothetical protein